MTSKIVYCVYTKLVCVFALLVCDICYVAAHTSRSKIVYFCNHVHFVICLLLCSLRSFCSKCQMISKVKRSVGLYVVDREQQFV